MASLTIECPSLNHSLLRNEVMKKIIYIAPFNLHKRHGGALATLAYYNAFRYLYGEDVHLMMPEEYCCNQFSDAIAVPHRSKSEVAIGCLKGRYHRYKDFLITYLKKFHSLYSVAVINGSFYAGDVIDLLHSYGIYVVVIHHNYEPEYQMDNKTPMTLGGRTSFFVVRNERKAYRCSDLNIFLTQNDKYLLKQHYGQCVEDPLVLGVFEPYHIEVFPGESQSNSSFMKNIVISGSMNTLQTVAGIMDLKEQYIEIVRRIGSEWNIIIAGRNPAPIIRQFVDQNSDMIRLVENPDNMDRIINQASIFLCPTNVGGGMKLRLMDGLRCGVPILTHAISARGYDALFSEEYFKIYSNKKDFANGLGSLIKYVETYPDFKIEVVKKYRKLFSFETGVEKVRLLMNKISAIVEKK